MAFLALDFRGDSLWSLDFMPQGSRSMWQRGFFTSHGQEAESITENKDYNEKESLWPTSSKLCPEGDSDTARAPFLTPD